MTQTTALPYIVCLLILLPPCLLHAESTDNPYPEDFFRERPRMPKNPRVRDGAWFGARFLPPEGVFRGLNDVSIGEGAQVGTVHYNSTASDMGLRYGDILLVMHGREINGIDQAGAAIGSYDTGDEVVAIVARDGERIELRAVMRSFLNSGFQAMSEAEKEAHMRRMQRERSEGRLLSTDRRKLARERARRLSLERAGLRQGMEPARLLKIHERYYEDVLGAAPGAGLPHIKLSGVPFSFSFRCDIDCSRFEQSVPVEYDRSHTVSNAWRLDYCVEVDADEL